MPTEQRCEILVIGAGPGGYVAAIRAGQLKKKVIIVEKDRWGGLCLNYGCIPSKALLYASEIIETIHKGEKYGIKAEKLSIDINQLREKKRKVVSQLVLGVETLLKHNGASMILGEASFVEPNLVKVVTSQGEEVRIIADNILIATGSLPFSVPSLPLDGKLIITSKEALEIPFVPKKMLVVGGGYVGMEMGVVYHSLGSEVTVMEMLDSIFLATDAQIVRMAQDRFKKKGINILTKTKVEKAQVTKDNKVQVTAISDGKSENMDFDLILVAIGHKATTTNLGLEKIGVQTDARGFIKVDEKMQTNIKNIFAVGDCAGKQLLAHKAYREGEVAAEVASGMDSEMDYRVVPYAIFTQPEVAGVGLTEKEAIDQGFKIKVGTYPYRAIGRAVGMDEQEGLVKIVADSESDEILGAHIIGALASELISSITVAMGLDARVEDVAEIIQVHPTLSEMIKEASLAVNKRAIHNLNPK
ncbi:MAG: dihydrolipoyl dehydrogenase [candidate division Zixibacteria bacterium RBG_16_40_9]|nr:MAG: dihydrolipoyl dehydrogenase [candidate division Zixibacteria bacterium RBG_16_40_9]